MEKIEQYIMERLFHIDGARRDKAQDVMESWNYARRILTKYQYSGDYQLNKIKIALYKLGLIPCEEKSLATWWAELPT